MGKIYTTTYEVLGDGVSLAAEYYAATTAARQAHWQFIESQNAEGYRPSHAGGLRSVLFAELPKGWRKIGRSGENIEAIPRKDSKAGKVLVQQIAELPLAPRPHELAAKFGYGPEHLALDSDSGVIYFPTEVRIAFPRERFFLRLPRFAGDGFEPDETLLRAIPESELMKALEDHNAEVRRLRETADA